MTSINKQWRLLGLGLIVLIGVGLGLFGYLNHQVKQRVFASYHVKKIIVTKPSILKINHQPIKVTHYRQKAQHGRLWSMFIIETAKPMRLSDNYMFLYRGPSEPFNNYMAETVKINGRATEQLRRGQNTVLIFTEYSFVNADLQFVLQDHYAGRYHQYWFKTAF